MFVAAVVAGAFIAVTLGVGVVILAEAASGAGTGVSLPAVGTARYITAAVVLVKRFEFHFTPKYGSWLNVQELEWSALARQALGERVGNRERLEQQVTHWLKDRRAREVKIDWQFTTVDAHIKLTRLYPQLSG